MLEEWLPVEGFPGYYVSNLGRVMKEDGRFLKLSPNQSRVYTVALFIEGHAIRRAVSLLVAHAFVGEPPEPRFTTVMHLDGDRANCRADNLVWRPRAFAINFHRQFLTDRFARWRQDIRLIETGEVFSNPREIAVKYGVLENYVIMNMNNDPRTPVFPHYFNFEPA